MSTSKPKQPFLKKGTRQFLSNATVRSLSQKPKIVQYQQSNDDIYTNPISSNNRNVSNNHANNIKTSNKIQSQNYPNSLSNIPNNNQKKRPPFSQNNLNQEEDIIIPIKKKNRQNSKPFQHYDTQDNNFENKINYQRNNNEKKQKRSVSKQKNQKNKRTTMLQDYLDQNNNDQSSYKKKTTNKSGNMREKLLSKQKKSSENKNNLNYYLDQEQQNFKQRQENVKKNSLKHDVKKPMKSMAKMLQQQDYQEMEESHHFMLQDEEEKKFTQLQSKKQLSKGSQNCSKQKKETRIFDEKPKVISYNMLQSMENKQKTNEVVFKDDSGDDERKTQKRSKPQINQNQKKQAEQQLSFNKFLKERQKEKQAQSVNSNLNLHGQNGTTSKVAQKYFGIKGNSSNNNAKSQNQPTININSLTIDIIPKQLKRQIIKTHLKQKQEQLQKQLKLLQNQKYNAKRGVQKNEEQKRKLMKQRQQFEKQMELRQAQFQQKIKSQNSKLNRQKKYMKGHQQATRGDWKQKNQLQQAKKLLQQITNDKKKNQLKFKNDIQRLKKLLNEQTNKNKLLQDQIKLLEHGQIQNKVQIKQLKVKLQNKQKSLSVKANPWSDYPIKSITDRFLNDDFHLYEFLISDYHYENLAQYQFCRRHENDIYEIQSQTSDDNKITRVYKNKKIETEWSNRFLKQDFVPLKFSIIFYIQQDLKIKLPNGFVVHYDARTDIVQFMHSQKSKQINYFINRDQVDMKWKTPYGQYYQVYTKQKWKSCNFNGDQKIKVKNSNGFFE